MATKRQQVNVGEWIVAVVTGQVGDEGYIRLEGVNCYLAEEGSASFLLRDPAARVDVSDDK